MTKSRIAHRAEFSVRCACGKEYHTSDEHLGKQLHCRCGRTVTIQRPQTEYGDAHRANDQRGHWQESSSSTVARITTSIAKRFRRFQPALRRGVQHRRRGVVSLLASTVSSMQDRSPWTRWTARLSWVWLLFVVTTWVVLISTSESFLPATLLAYGPRFPLLLPLLIFLPMALMTARSALVPLVLSLWVIWGPIMGGRMSWRTLGKALPTAPASGAIRVVTYNAQNGRVVAPKIRNFVETYHPDLMAFQECGEQLMDSLRALSNWYFARYANLCTASRWPIESMDSMPRNDIARISQYGFEGTGLVARFIIASPRGPLALINLHLETARKGLEALAGNEGLLPDELNLTGMRSMIPRADAMERLDINEQIRERESERASVWARRGDKRIPTILVGDYNLPVESAIFRRHWGDLTDAFEKTGTGFGWSKREGQLLRIRIDHVLLNPSAPIPVGTWLGPDMGSDHLPVVADLKWRPR